VEQTSKGEVMKILEEQDGYTKVSVNCVITLKNGKEIYPDFVFTFSPSFTEWRKNETNYWLREIYSKIKESGSKFIHKEVLYPASSIFSIGSPK
jgi:hypothetical protein